MSDFAALNTAVSGLFAHRQRINTISDNIANVDTPGYHRKLTNLSPIDSRYPGLWSGPDGQHGGVSADVSRQWDQLLDTNAKQELSRSSSLETQASALSGLEAELGSLAAGGLADRLQQLWNSFDDLANDPSDLAIRNVVLGNAETVASELNAQAGTIDRLRGNEVERLTLRVDRVNELADAIAELDRRITAGVAAGTPPAGLLDKRDQMASELAGLVRVQVSYETDGQIRLSVDGHSLVNDGQARSIEVAVVPDPALTALGYNRVAVVTGPGGRELNLSGGSIHGGLQAANDLLPGQRQALDTVAASVVNSVNVIHQAGTGLDGSTGLSLFDPAGIRAGSVAVSTDVAGQPEKLAASDGSGTLDNSTARALALLGEDPTGPSAVHAQLVADLGSAVANLSGRADASRLAYSNAESNRQSAVGVSLDEELADLVSAQRAYEASSRMISTIDEMLDVLINRTGIVGR